MSSLLIFYMSWRISVLKEYLFYYLMPYISDFEAVPIPLFTWTVWINKKIQFFYPTYLFPLPFSKVSGAMFSIFSCIGGILSLQRKLITESPNCFFFLLLGSQQVTLIWSNFSSTRFLLRRSKIKIRVQLYKTIRK